MTLETEVGICSWNTNGHRMNPVFFYFFFFNIFNIFISPKTQQCNNTFYKKHNIDRTIRKTLTHLQNTTKRALFFSEVPRLAQRALQFSFRWQCAGTLETRRNTSLAHWVALAVAGGTWHGLSRFNEPPPQHDLTRPRQCSHASVKSTSRFTWSKVYMERLGQKNHFLMM